MARTGEPADAVETLAEAAGVVLRPGPACDWAAVEASLDGLRLPADYRRVVDGFPHGWFREALTVIRPGIEGGSDREYLGFFATQLEDMRGWRADGHGAYPYPIHPEPGGLLPWGYGPMGELFFWLTADPDPDRWPVIWADTRYSEWHRLPVSMSEFLLRLVTDPPPEVTALLTGGAAFRSFPAGAPVALPPGVGFTTEPGAPVERAADHGVPVDFSAGAKGPSGFSAGVADPEDEVFELLDALGADPDDGTDRDWPAIERHWGLGFPEDFRTFYDTLGPGLFCDIAVFGPDGPDGWNMADLLRHARSRTPQPEYLVLHPDPGGIVPWGLTPDGWIFGWQPRGDDPASWGVTAYGPDNHLVSSPEWSFSTFLLHYAGVYDQDALFLFARDQWSGRPQFRGSAPGG